MLRACLLTAMAAGIALGQGVPLPPPLVQRQDTPAQAKPPAPRPASAAKPPAGASYKDLKFPPLRPIELPAVTRKTLSNGMKLLLVEDHETPVVSGWLMSRVGTAFDSPDRIGLAALTSSLLRNGGTRLKTPEQVDGELESLGATLDSVIGETLGVVSFSALKESAAPALAVFRDVVTTPAFRQDRIDLAKNAVQNGISRRNDDPREVLRRETRALLFGKDNPYGWMPEYATVASIGRPQIVEFYRRHYFPANATLAVVGDFDSTQMAGAIEALFSEWKEQQPPLPDPPNAAAKPASGAYLAQKREMNQTLFAIGQPGGEYGDKDAAAIELMTTILGNTNQSRLAQKARAAQGSIREFRAEWATGVRHPGTFTIVGAVASATAADNVKAAIEELQRLRSTEPTEEEMRIAREGAQVRLAMSLDTKSKALQAIATYDAFGLPPDYLQQYQKALAAVTRADVLRVAKERLNPDQLVVVAVSDLTVFNHPLDPRGGATNPIDLTIPAPKIAPAKSDTASLDQGKQMVLRAQQASGGADKLAAIKDLTQTIQYVLAGGQEEKETDQWIAPSTLRQEGVSARLGRLYRYTDGANGWISNGVGSAALLGANLKNTLGDLFRLPVPLLLSDRVSGRSVGGLDEQTVEIVQGDQIARLVFDPATGLPARMLYDIQNEKGAPVFCTEEYSDFREEAGVKLPHAVKVFQGGVKYADGEIAYKVNSGLKVEVLQRRP